MKKSLFIFFLIILIPGLAHAELTKAAGEGFVILAALFIVGLIPVPLMIIFAIRRFNNRNEKTIRSLNIACIVTLIISLPGLIISHLGPLFILYLAFWVTAIILLISNRQ